MIKYIRATWVPLTFTLIIWTLGLLTWGTLWSVLFILITLLGIADVRARFRDYVELVTTLSYVEELISPEGEFAWRDKPVDKKKARAILYRYRTSRCQRTVAIHACRDVGLGNLGYEYFYEKGYRWYHILPDGTFSKKCPYFRLSFYRNLLGV